jgi:DNA-binding protein HU-beta
VNKSELVDAIAADADLNKSDAGRALDAAIENITKALSRGDQVALVGFGTFSAKPRAARQGRNPQTGETIEIKAAMVPGFKAGKALKDALNS